MGPGRVVPAVAQVGGRLGLQGPFQHRWLTLGAVIIGIMLASAIQLLTGYFTETNRRVGPRHWEQLGDRPRSWPPPSR